MKPASNEHATGPSRGGFTLIEMLVVIAIMALLAALLVPSVTRALRRGVSQTCLSNLRQNGQAIDLYIEDHDGYWPTHPSSNGIWASQTAKVSTDNKQLRYHLSPYLGTKGATLKYEPTFLCPGTSRLPSRYKDNVQYLANHSASLGGRSREDVWGYPDNGQIPKKRIEAPSTEWLLMDVDQVHFSINPGWGNYADFAPYPGHYDRWNTLYFDLHVGYMFP